MNRLRPHTARFFAIAVILILYNLSRLPELVASERTSLASRFGFASIPLYEPAGFEYRTIRQVHPDLEHIAAWLSAFKSSAIALNDLDGDGLANDTCHVDARIDQVIISPAPGAPARYQPFILAHPGHLYDATKMAPVGCVPNDMNEDGRMDLLIYYWGRTPLAFLNNGASSLIGDSYTPREILPGDDVWWSSAGTFADFDGDGHVDLLITNYFPDSADLLGDGAGKPINLNHSLSRAFNGGGTYLFLWEGATAGVNPTVTFRKIEDVFDKDISHAWTLAVGAADLDGDLLPEIYFSNDYGPDRLLHNRSRPGALNFAVLEGEKFLTTPNSKVLGHDSFKGMGVDFGDLNDDGLFDIYVSNIAADYAFHESHFMFLSTGEIERMQAGVAPYVDYSESLGVSRSSWSWESRLADFNNDGVLEAIQATGFLKGQLNRWPELQELGLGNDELSKYSGNWPRFQPGDNLNGHEHNRFFVRSASGRFFDLARELGIDQLQVTRGIATADVDGDGDLDFAIANQWETSLFYQNNCPHCGNFLGLHLLLPVAGSTSPARVDVIRPGHPGADTPGRPAIGAVAKVQLPDERQLIGLVDGGNGQAGERSSDLHFGLGQLDPGVQLAVELHWRDSDGHVNQKTVQLTPGWHTLLLANERIVSK
ncbi:MAG: RNA-binding protein [Anaerolineae bacterium]|nr:RNA-binding protein [Anaerolineae bacterium]